MQIVETLQEKQAGDLLDDFEGIGNAAVPELISDAVNLAANFTGEPGRRSICALPMRGEENGLWCRNGCHLKPGDPLTFKVRTFRDHGGETWDFGDCSAQVKVQSDVAWIDPQGRPRPIVAEGGKVIEELV